MHIDWIVRPIGQSIDMETWNRGIKLCFVTWAILREELRFHLL